MIAASLFYASKMLVLFFMPYPLILYSLVVMAFLFPPIKLRFFLRLSVFSLFALSSPILAWLLSYPLERAYPALKLQEIEEADAIVVLGGMIAQPARSSSEPEFLRSVDRILAGIRLLKQAKAPYLVLAGASSLMHDTALPESLVLKNWLIKEQGLSLQKIIVEKQSRNTAENAKYFDRLAKERSWKNVLLVTSAYHIPRSMLYFSQTGLQIIPVPVDYMYHSKTFTPFSFPESLFPSLSSLAVSNLAFREYTALLFSCLRICF